MDGLGGRPHGRSGAVLDRLCSAPGSPVWTRLPPIRGATNGGRRGCSSPSRALAPCAAVGPAPLQEVMAVTSNRESSTHRFDRSVRARGTSWITPGCPKQGAMNVAKNTLAAVVLGCLVASTTGCFVHVYREHHHHYYHSHHHHFRHYGSLRPSPAPDNQSSNSDAARRHGDAPGQGAVTF